LPQTHSNFLKNIKQNRSYQGFANKIKISFYKFIESIASTDFQKGVSERNQLLMASPTTLQPQQAPKPIAAAISQGTPPKIDLFRDTLPKISKSNTFNKLVK